MKINWITTDSIYGKLMDKVQNYFLTDSELYEYPNTYRRSMKYLLEHSSEKFTEDELTFFSELLNSDDMSNLQMVYYIITAKDE